MQEKDRVSCCSHWVRAVIVCSNTVSADAVPSIMITFFRVHKLINSVRRNFKKNQLADLPRISLIGKDNPSIQNMSSTRTYVIDKTFMCIDSCACKLYYNLRIKNQPSPKRYFEDHHQNHPDDCKNTKSC